MYNCSTSPTARRTYRFEPLPFNFTRFNRMYFCANGAGSTGKVFASQRSSRCPESFFPMVNSLTAASLAFVKLFNICPDLTIKKCFCQIYYSHNSTNFISHKISFLKLLVFSSGAFFINSSKTPNFIINSSFISFGKLLCFEVTLFNIFIAGRI